MFEVNLVPELKHDAIRALRTRNIILFVCIAASLVSLGIVLILLSIKGGQDITMASQDGRIDLLSSKLNAFSDLNEILTIQDQASNLSTISAEKNAISRIFGLLVVMQDRGQDSVTFSAIDLTTDTFTMSLEGQVDARTEPYIDYRVLEEFKKNTEKITLMITATTLMRRGTPFQPIVFQTRMSLATTIILTTMVPIMLSGTLRKRAVTLAI